jgi:teichoic acid transport system permease protein
VSAKGTSADLHNLGVVDSTSGYLKELWRRREYAIEVPLGNLRAAHMNTLLGNIWHVLNPLMLVGVYYLVFGILLPRVSEGTENYIAFLTIGVFVFRFTQSSVQQAAGSIVDNSNLIRSIHFPRALLPISVLVEQILLLSPSMIVTLVIVVLTGEQPHWSWLWLPAVFFLQSMFNLGAGFIAARVTDTFRDFQNVLPYVFRILVYVSGVLFSIEAIAPSHPWALELSYWNPAYAYITLARGSIFGSASPTEVVVSAVLWAVVALVLGFYYFRAAESTYGRG